MRSGEIDFLEDVDAENSTNTIETPCVDVTNTLVINVGGLRHEVLRSTLESRPGTKFTNKKLFELHYRPGKKEYYFDRNPQVFTSIINYLRTGELHAPVDVCGSVFKVELTFWGIDDQEIQQCCWIRYCSDLDTKHTLKRFKNKVVPCSSLPVHQTRWELRRRKAWDFFDKPYSSLAAKIYACISLLVIITSVTVFCAGSHPSVKQNMTAEHYSKFYKAPLDRFTDYGNYFYYYDYEEDGRKRRDTRMAHEIKLLDLEASSVRKGRYNKEALDRQRRAAHDDTYTDDDSGESGESGDMPSNEMYPGLYDDMKPTREKNRIDVDLSPPHPVLDGIDSACVAFFTLELMVRFIFCPSKLRFFITPLNIIDLVALLPFYIEVIVNHMNTTEQYQHSIVDVLFMLQVLRILRVFRLIRHVKGLRVLMYTVRYGWREMILMLLFLIIGMLFFGTLIFFTDYQRGQFQSIPHAFWWAIITMTTVGYGDVFPQTNGGYCVGALCAFTGVLVIAFSVPSLVNNFMLFYSHVQYEKAPRCCKNHTLRQNSTDCQGTEKNGGLEVESNIQPFQIPVKKY